MPDLPDPRGDKTPAQTYKVYCAATKDPADPGEWTLSTTLQFDSLQGNSGSTPNLCILHEPKAPPEDSFKGEAVPPDFEEALTGGGTEGTIFCGADISVDALVKVEASVLGSPTTYKPIFIGVVVKATLDLGAEFVEWHCEDYRHFMRKACVYGRMIYDPNVEETPVFIRGARTTFNEGGKPDRYQEGEALAGADFGRYLPIWLPPFWNRADQTYPGGPADPGEGTPPDAPWADYWLAGHVWMYIQKTYFDTPPAALSHLDCSAFINMPTASDDPKEEEMFWLFENEVDGPVMLSDFAVTGISLDKILGMILQKAGPYDWTLAPNADGNTADIVVFHTHEGTGSAIDYTWGDYGQTEHAAAPDVLDGKISRDQTEFHNRAYGLSRRRVVETTLTMRPEQFAAEAPASLVHDADPDDIDAYLAAVAAGSADALKEDYYGAVYRRYRVPAGYDWGTYVFNGAKILTTGAHGARMLLTTGSAFKSAFDPAPVFRPMRTMVWRNKNVSPAAPTWEPKPDYIGVEVLADCCGIQLDANARSGSDPWTWNGNTASPVAYEIMVTMAVEVTEPIDIAISNMGEGDRAREFFLDAGNTYRSGKRINAVMTADGDNKPTTYKVAGLHTFGTPADPDVFIDEEALLEAELTYRLAIKNATNIQGNLVLWGLRIDPWPIGHLVGSLTVPANPGEDPPPNKRSAMELNACVRSFRMDRAADTTTYTLDGR